MFEFSTFDKNVIDDVFLLNIHVHYIKQQSPTTNNIIYYNEIILNCISFGGSNIKVTCANRVLNEKHLK